MIKSKTTTKKNLSLLLSGKHRQSKKYEGKHVFVVKDKITPLEEGKNSLSTFKKLKEKYKEKPTLVFVPRNETMFLACLADWGV